MSEFDREGLRDDRKFSKHHFPLKLHSFIVVLELPARARPCKLFDATVDARLDSIMNGFMVVVRVPDTSEQPFAEIPQTVVKTWEMFFHQVFVWQASMCC